MGSWVPIEAIKFAIGKFVGDVLVGCVILAAFAVFYIVARIFEKNR